MRLYSCSACRTQPYLSNKSQIRRAQESYPESISDILNNLKRILMTMTITMTMTMKMTMTIIKKVQKRKTIKEI